MRAGTASRRRVAKRWADIGKHDLVEVKGALYTVVKNKDLGNGKRKVTIRHAETGTEYTSKVEAKHGTDVIELVKRTTKAWNKPDDKAEELVVEMLGGVLVGIKPSEDECYIVPLVDISTIAAHLYLFHGISPVDVRKAGGYEEAVAIHDTEHAKPVESLLTPHIHERDRPVVEIGPVFR